MPAVARYADDAGFDGIWTFETAHEPFLPSAAALAARIVAKRVEFADPEMAFLTGLLHDVGEMVLFNSDRADLNRSSKNPSRRPR